MTRCFSICCAGSTQKEQPNIDENVGSLQFWMKHLIHDVNHNHWVMSGSINQETIVQVLWR